MYRKDKHNNSSLVCVETRNICGGSRFDCPHAETEKATSNKKVNKEDRRVYVYVFVCLYHVT